MNVYIDDVKQVNINIFKPSISKDEIAGLPIAKFRGECIVVNDEKGANEAAKFLLTQEVIGLDTETKPVFNKGGMNPVALLQLSTLDRCYLIRLCKTGKIPDSIKKVLESESIKKIGLSFADDISALGRREKTKLNNIVELQQMAPKFGITDKSLAKMYAIIFGEQISKRQRLTNWEAPKLTEKQVQYAALDAYATLSIYLCLNDVEKGISVDDQIHTKERREYEKELEARKEAIYAKLNATTKVTLEDKESNEKYLKELENLYFKIQGKPVQNIELLKAAGSGRKYYRLSGEAGTFIGTIGESVTENEAFFAIAASMKKNQILCPKVFMISGDKMCYLQSDLGNISLLDAISDGVKKGNFSAKSISLLINTIEQLPKIQFLVNKNLDYSVCYPDAEFTKEALMADLEKFRGCFLNHHEDVTYDRAAITKDFEKVCDDFIRTKGKYWGFMYRDFQTRNIMMRGINPAFIDFQGGRLGPCLYDVASFVYQARANFPDKLKSKLINAYIKKLNEYVEVNESEVREQLNFFVFLRMIQVLGAYGLRGYIEGKKMFLDSIPKALENVRPFAIKYINKYPELGRVLKNMTKSKYDNSILNVRVMSFSYKKGIPEDNAGNGGGYVFDCRAVHNPGKYDEYKSKTGLDESVKKFLEDDGEILTFLDSVYALADAHVERYMERGFSNLMFCFGCTGGQHRSVYSAQHLAEHLSEKYGVQVNLEHREQGITQLFELREE